jgi:very-short-patch-repair endonuclease
MPRKSRGKTTAKIVQAARNQRRQQTPAEKKLWEALRDRRLAGLKFRRQHPFQQFILDAFCVEYQLEVEVDGEVHDDPPQAAYDAERTEFLRARGIRVLRFRNEEIEDNLEDVLKRIVEATKTSPPNPLS